MIRVVLADDDPLLRAGIAAVASTHDGIEVVGEAGSGRHAVALCRELVPDVVVMDVRMPDLDGIAATRQVVADGLPTRVLVLTTFAHDDHVAGALRAGASGFLLKRVPPEELLAAIETVAAGDALIDPAVTRQVVAAFARPDRPRPRAVPGLDQLTERETEVLREIAAGHSNTEIAARLVVAESTVKTHVKHVFAKLGLRDRVAAVIAAYESGLVTPGGEP